MESEPGGEQQFYSADAEIFFGAFLLHSRDASIRFCLLKHQLFVRGIYTGSPSCELPFLHPKVCARVCLVPRPDKSAPMCV